MTDDIDALSPEQLRVAVAIEVMGWRNTRRVCESITPAIRMLTPYKRTVLTRPEWKDEYAEEPPDYPNDIAAAWQVKKEMTKSGEWGFVLHNDGNGWCVAEFTYASESWLQEGDGSEQDEADCICRAALRAVRAMKGKDK